MPTIDQTAITDLVQRVPRGSRSLGLGLVAVGVGSAVLALAGPLVGGLLRYHVSAGATSQVLGGDVAGLLLLAPVAIVAGVLVLRGRLLGAALGMGPAAYGLYTWFQLATTGDPGRYPGTASSVFPLLEALFVLAAWVLVRCWQELSRARPLPPASVVGDRMTGVFLLVVASFLILGLHLPGLLAVAQGSPTPELTADPGVFWVVKLMDLLLVVPLLLVAGTSLVRHPGRDGLLRYAVTGWSTMLGAAVAGMGVVMTAQGHPGGSVPMAATFIAFAGVAGVVTVQALRPLRDVRLAPEVPGRAGTKASGARRPAV
ncbi:hypothetical protein ACI3EY_06810 [Ornithinimicrobium sp. LYQ92]|uniref:hypothetical protein n=1 Tax=Serinicoccus sp. LYQ92 TaxID=3378798 RepID=UPI003852BEDF